VKHSQFCNHWKWMIIRIWFTFSSIICPNMNTLIEYSVQPYLLLLLSLPGIIKIIKKYWLKWCCHKDATGVLQSVKLMNTCIIGDDICVTVKMSMSVSYTLLNKKFSEENKKFSVPKTKSVAYIGSNRYFVKTFDFCVYGRAFKL